MDAGVDVLLSDASLKRKIVIWESEMQGMWQQG